MTRYLAPYATVELALILINGGQIDEAGLLLETAKYVHHDAKHDLLYHDKHDLYDHDKHHMNEDRTNRTGQTVII